MEIKGFMKVGTVKLSLEFIMKIVLNLIFFLLLSNFEMF